MADSIVIPQRYEPECSIDLLKVHPQNPNQGDVGALTESMDELGFFGAIMAQESTGFCIAGNHRLLAAMSLGQTTLPVIWCDVSDEVAIRIMLGDNRYPKLASTDDPVLATLLTELAQTSSGLRGTGYDGDDLDDLLNMLNEDKPKRERKEKSSFNVIVRCQDATDQQDVLSKLLAAGYNATTR